MVNTKCRFLYGCGTTRRWVNLFDCMFIHSKSTRVSPLRNALFRVVICSFRARWAQRRLISMPNRIKWFSRFGVIFGFTFIQRQFNLYDRIVCILTGRSKNILSMLKSLSGTEIQFAMKTKFYGIDRTKIKSFKEIFACRFKKICICSNQKKKIISILLYHKLYQGMIYFFFRFRKKHLDELHPKMDSCHLIMIFFHEIATSLKNIHQNAFE